MSGIAPYNEIFPLYSVSYGALVAYVKNGLPNRVLRTWMIEALLCDYIGTESLKIIKLKEASVKGRPGRMTYVHLRGALYWITRLHVRYILLINHNNSHAILLRYNDSLLKLPAY